MASDDRRIAAVFAAIGEHDQRLAALLLFHDVLRRIHDGIVKQSAAAVLAAQLVARGRVDIGQRLVQIPARPGERLPRLHGQVELHDEHVVLVFAKNLVEETQAGAALGIEHVYLAHAGVDHESDGQGKIGFAREITDGLRAAVFEDLEIVFRQIAKDFVILVSDRGEKVDNLNVGGKCGILRLRAARQEERCGGDHEAASGIAWTSTAIIAWGRRSYSVVCLCCATRRRQATKGDGMPHGASIFSLLCRRRCTARPS